MSAADDRNDQEAKGARYEQIFRPRLYPSTKRERAELMADDWPVVMGAVLKCLRDLEPDFDNEND